MICPLYQAHNEEIETDHKILFEKVSNRRALKPEIFDHTHYKITAYVNGKILPENQLYEKINPRIATKGSKCMVILGGPGIGKSELCSYFRKELNKQGLGKYVLYLDKSASLYDIVTDRLPKFYQQATGKKFEFHSDGFKRMEHASLAAAEIMFSMLEKLNKSLLPYLNDNLQIQKNFQAHLAEGIRRIFQKDIKNIEAKGLNPFDAELVSLCSTEDWLRTIKRFFPKDDNEKLSEKLNEAFSHAIYHVSQVPPFSSLLKKIAIEIGRKIWIIFEDYEMPYLDNKEILNFAEADQTEIDVQFVIALIPDRWENLSKMLGMTFTDRATFVEFKGGNENFLNSQTCIQFIEPFLTYHKEFYPKSCKNCKKCPEDIKTTFPMNVTFLKRIFEGLSKDDQNPRKYVEIIGSFLDDFIKNEITPFDNKHLLGKIHVADIPTDLEEGFHSLSCWYFITQNKEELKNWCKIFNIKYEEGNKQKDSKSKSENTDDIFIDEKYVNLRSKIRNYLESPLEPRWKECGDFIQSGLIKVLESLTDDHCIQGAWSSTNPPSIIYNFPGKGNVLSLTKKKDTLSYDFIPLKLPMKVGEELLKIGYNNSSTADFENHLSIDLVQFIVPMIFEWREQVKQHYCSQQFGEKNKDFNTLTLLCYKLLENFENPFNLDDKNLKLEKNGLQYIKNIQVEKLGEKLIKHIDNKQYIFELLQWNHSIGGDIYPSILNETIKPWDELKNFQKSKVDKILDGNLRYKHSGPKVELSALLQEIFIFAKELNDKQYSKEIDNDQFTKISNLISDVSEENISKIIIAADLSFLDGKPIKSVFKEIAQKQYYGFKSLNDLTHIFLNEKNEGLRAIQAKYLFNNKLFFLLDAVISDQLYKDTCKKDQLKLIEFCKELITDSEKEKEKKEHEQFEKEKNKLIDLIKRFEILENAKEIKKDLIIPDITKLKDIGDIQKYISAFEQKWWAYTEKERGSIYNLEELNEIFKILPKAELEFEKCFNTYVNNPSSETLNDYIHKRNNLQDKLKEAVPALGTEKVIKLLKGEKILFSSLTQKEINDILTSKLKDFISIGLGKL